MKRILDHLYHQLEEREHRHALRVLKTDTGLIDFCSNDYLGFARSARLRQLITEGLHACPEYASGATGSRLISGNDAFTVQLEQEISRFHEAEAGLIFNSGYDANVGLFSSLAQRGDTIITDELIHASIIDGTRLNNANRFVFKHNDLNSLEEKLKAAKGNIFIAVESIYSMDGDEAPLTEIVALANRYYAAVIVDEAHATGIMGIQGRGLVHAYGLQNQVLARVITFGKAMGCHGAIVLGSTTLREYLVNFARSFIYSTAASFYTHLSVKMAYQYLQETDHQAIIHQNITKFKALTKDLPVQLIASNSAIQSIIVGGNEQTKALSSHLAKKGYDIRAILHPTVPEGRERLRICLHTFNTDQEIGELVISLQENI